MSIVMTVLTNRRDIGFTMYVLVSLSEDQTRVGVDTSIYTSQVQIFLILPEAC